MIRGLWAGLQRGSVRFRGVLGSWLRFCGLGAKLRTCGLEGRTPH